MKQHLFAAALALLLATGTAFAQDGGDRRRTRQDNFDITEVYNRQATRLAKDMKLKDGDKDRFTALYLDYQNTRHNAVNPTGGNQERAEERADLSKLTDEEAAQLIQRNFERQEKQLQVDKDYLPKFLEILTPAQAARVYLQRGGSRPGMGSGGNRPDGRPGFGGPGFGGPGPGGGGF